MTAFKQWLVSHHSAILATLVAMQGLPYLRGTAKAAVVLISNIVAAMPQ